MVLEMRDKRSHRSYAKRADQMIQTNAGKLSDASWMEERLVPYHHVSRDV